jgi:hypothetical protein
MIADLLDITEDDARGLCELAGHDLAMARYYRECAEGCDDGALRNDYARSYRGCARSYRQTLAMKLRLKQALLQADRAAAAELRKEVEARREAAERERRDAVEAHHMAVRVHFERLLWDEYEEPEAEDLLTEIDGCLLAFAEVPGFLETPVPTLIQRLERKLRQGQQAARDADPDGEEEARPPPEAGATNRVRPGPVPDPGVAESGSCPSPPPDPPSAPYAPPRETLRPGERRPGGGPGG